MNQSKASGAITFGNVSQQIGYIKAGRLRALAVTSAMRSSLLPDLPTVAEAGVPGYDFVTWHGIRAPKAPAPARVEAAVRRCISCASIDRSDCTATGV